MQAPVFRGTAVRDFSVAVRGQLVDYRSGQRIDIDQAIYDMLSDGDVEWDKPDDQAAKRRGRQPPGE